MWLEQFKSNMIYWWHYATAWVVGIWALAFGFWQTLDDGTKATYYAMAPFGIGKYLPFALLIVAYITAHGWPQPNLEAKIEVKKLDMALDKAATQDANQAGA
jgi:hypothetical protein